MYTVCGPILASFFFEMTIKPNRFPKRPSMIIAGARYVDEKIFKLNSISVFLNFFNERKKFIIIYFIQNKNK